jgi:hypothetical protein
MTTKEFPKGLIVKRAPENAPDFVKAKVSIKRTELIEWLQSKDKDWINLDLLNSKKNILYLVVNDFETQKQENEKNKAPEKEDSFLF